MAKFSIFVYDFHTIANSASERNFIRVLPFDSPFHTRNILMRRPCLSSQENFMPWRVFVARPIFSISAPFSFVHERAWKFSILTGKVTLVSCTINVVFVITIHRFSFFFFFWVKKFYLFLNDVEISRKQCWN